MNPFKITLGNSPLILGQPHGGTYVPDDIAARLNRRGQGLDDTDWHINRLYDGLVKGATVVEATFHRYVIDANRDPGGASLYPGQNTTTLCPTTDFDGHNIWRDGQAPGADETDARRARFHAPYHAALAGQIDRVKTLHGFAILYDCHSIRSDIPFLFDGILPTFCVGTNDGQTCDPLLESAAMDAVRTASGTDHVLNGRFKGGWTTRQYGHPDQGCHAIQMELAQHAYMNEAAPWAYRPDRADPLRRQLSGILNEIVKTAQTGAFGEAHTNG